MTNQLIRSDLADAARACRDLAAERAARSHSDTAIAEEERLCALATRLERYGIQIDRAEQQSSAA